MSDNFHFDITSESRKHFDLAFDIGWISLGTGWAYTYKIDSNKGLIFSYSMEEKNGYIKLPYPMSKEIAREFAWGWLNTSASYGLKPDHDGDNEKGFRVYNEAWNKVDSQWESFLAVQPIWMMYGK